MRGRHFLAVSAVTLICLIDAPIAAAEPVTAPNCSSTVEGTPGQPVLLDPASVAEPVVRALAELDPLGLLTPAFRTAWAGTAPIPVGTVPDGRAEVTGTRIADAVIARLGDIAVLGPVLRPLGSAVRNTLASVCVILLRATRPPLPDGTTPPVPAPAGPGGGDGGNPAAGGAVTAGGGLRLPQPDAGTGAVFGSLPAEPTPGAALFPMTTGGVPGSPEIPAPAAASAPSRPVIGSAETLPVKEDELFPAALAALISLSIVSAFFARRCALSPRHRSR
ncbi:hypothetical protein ACFWY9_11920 [Amycolatopsis sp. NPDC059027]|uniref:hypothetical protein n=1 Tax=Amycolatopsis sp. NPDC059027 TaxID=3346709 RepID=UPI00366C1A87